MGTKWRWNRWQNSTKIDKQCHIGWHDGIDEKLFTKRCLLDGEGILSSSCYGNVRAIEIVYIDTNFYNMIICNKRQKENWEFVIRWEYVLRLFNHVITQYLLYDFSPLYSFCLRRILRVFFFFFLIFHNYWLYTGKIYLKFSVTNEM